MGYLKVITLLLAIYSYSESAVISTTHAPLSSWCYKPPGNDCTWYNSCINKRYPCPNDNYAMKYANYFCESFGKNYDSFTITGKLWIDGTRQCLQRILVPYLDNFSTCSSLKQTAFDSHACCYLSGKQCTPASSNVLSISICQIPIKDWLRVFWTIKGSFNVFGGHSDIINTMKGTLKVMKGCTTSVLGDEVENVVPRSAMRQFKIQTNADGRSKRNAMELSDFIAEELDWDKKGLDWYGYMNEDESALHLLLADNNSIFADEENIVSTEKLNNIYSDLIGAADIFGIQSIKECNNLQCTF